MYFLHTVLDIFPMDLTGRMIISFVLVTSSFYSGVILYGEIRGKSILEFKGLTAKGFVDEIDDRSLSI